MRTISFVLALAMLLQPSVGSGADESLRCGEPNRQLAMPKPPRVPVIFTRTDRGSQESLEIRYLSPERISFRFTKMGRCERHERGIATIQPCWWLGMETDDNEAGEAVAVQEYFFDKNSQCTMSFRIDEWGWAQASVSEAPECSKNCPASGKLLHLRKR